MLSKRFPMSTQVSTASPINAGDALVLTIIDLTVDGGAMARHGDLVVFLDRGLPGETVRATVHSVSSRFAKATVLETVTPSPDAVAAPCPHVDLCGGCTCQNLAYPAQLAWKERHAKETLRRVGKVDPATVTWGDTPIFASPSELRYRNKVEFAFAAAPEEGTPLLGLRQRGSHELVEVTDCLLARVPLGEVLSLVRLWAKESGLGAWNGKDGFLRFLVVRMPEHSPSGKQACVVELITSKPSRKRPEETAAVEELFQRLESELPQVVTGSVHSLREHRAPVAYGERVLRARGESVVTEQIGHVKLEVPMQAFVQTNTGAALAMYEAVRSFAALTGTEEIWDLYCGVGSIGLFLAADAGSVRGFESVRAAVSGAKRNAELNSLANCAFTAGDIAELLESERGTPDLIVLDPPRVGLEARVIASLARKAPKRIISISCDPATQARDIAKLAPMYRVAAGQLVDLFPHTPHLESVYLLEKV